MNLNKNKNKEFDNRIKLHNPNNIFDNNLKIFFKFRK